MDILRKDLLCNQLRVFRRVEGMFMRDNEQFYALLNKHTYI